MVQTDLPAATEAIPLTARPETTGGEAMVASLVANGVDTLFGLPGIQLDGLFAALHDRQDEISVIHPRHEQTVAYMADGYARVSGKEGVAVVVPGPGVLNAAAGLATAYACNSPVLCIAGQVRSDLVGQNRGALHEIPNQTGMLWSVAKAVARPRSPRDVPTVVGEAFRALRSGRPRPVAVEVSPDTLVASEQVPAPRPAAPRSPLAPDPDLVEVAARRLGTAFRPLIVAGGGVVRAGASEALLRVAELLQAPVVMTRNGKGAISDRHPLAHGPVALREMLAGADALLVVGSRFPDPGEPTPDLRGIRSTVRIDIDPEEFGRFGPRAVEVLADADSGLAALAERLPAHNRRRTDRTAELSALQRAVRQRVEAIEPQAGFAMAIRAEVPDEGIVVSEFTQVSYWSYLGFPVYAPNTFLTPGYQGTLGYGFPTALGAKVGRPDVPVVSVNGDGGFGYGLSELSTMVQHEIPVVAIVFDDNAYGNVKRIQREQFGGRVIASDLVNPDYRTLAAAFGVPFRRAETPAGLRVALREAIAANEPTLIHVPIGETPDPWRALGLR